MTELDARRARAIVVVTLDTTTPLWVRNLNVACPDDVRIFFLVGVNPARSRFRTFAPQRLPCVEVITGIRSLGVDFLGTAGGIFGLHALTPSLLLLALCACSAGLGFSLHPLGFRLLLARALCFLSRSPFTPPGLLKSFVRFRAKLVGLRPLPLVKLLAALRQEQEK